MEAVEDMAPQNQVDQPQGKTMQSKPNEKHLEFLQNNIARMNQWMYNDLIGVGNGEKQTIVQIKEYEIPMEKYSGCQYCILKAMFSPSELLLYGAIIAGLFYLYKTV